MDEKQYPPELLQRARQLRNEGEFHRKIVKRVPENLQWDKATLSCDHTVSLLVEGPTIDGVACGQCADEWLAAQMVPAT